MLENLLDGWNVVKAGELAAPGKHSCVGGPFGSNLVRQDYVEYPGVPVIRGGNLILGSRIFQDFDFVFVSEEKAASLQQNTAYPGDLVFMQRGASIGQVSLIPKNAKFSRYILSQNLMKLTPDPQKADVKFLCYYFLSPLAQELIQRHSVGSTIPGFNLTQLRDFPVPLPPLGEQKAIAHILGTLDDKIELNQQMNHTLESIARALFKSWFIDFDPVRAKMDGRQPAGMDAETAALFPDEFEDSAIGQIPKGWKVKQLHEISKNESEAFDFSCHPNVIFLNTGDIAWGQFLHANYSSKDGLPGQAKKAIRKNDILFSEIRPANGRYAFVDFTPTNYVVSTKFMVIRASDEIHPRLLYRVLTRPETLAELQVIADSRSGTFPQITFTSIGHLTFILPPIPIQSAYQSLVAPLDRKAKIHDLEAQSLSSIRDALLPKLLSGEIRVKDTERVVEAAA